MRQTLVRRNYVVLMGPLLISVLAAQAEAVDRAWIDASVGLNNWNDATNWNPGDDFAEAADNAIFDQNASYVVIVAAPSAASNVSFRNGSVTLGGGSLNSGGIVTIDDALAAGLGDGATVILNGPNWDNVGDARVGDAGLGTLTINGSGDFRSEDFFIGDQAGAVGVVNVDGDGATLQTDGLNDVNGFFIGNAGTGTLNVTGGGLARIVNDVTGGIANITLGNAADGEGTLNVAGVGAMNPSQVIAEDVFIGNAGTGHLHITAGGILNQNISTTPDAFVAQQIDSSGDVTVNGNGSQWLMMRLEIGNLGDATLSIEAGGLVHSTSNDMTLGDAGGSGRVAVFGAGVNNSTLQVANDIYVGSAGLGELRVGQDLLGAADGNGRLVVGSDLFVGNNAGNNFDNKVVVSGNSATANIGAQLQVGVSGKGTFEARNGATITVGTALSAGSLPSGNGNILIDGPGTTLSSSTLFLGNGNAGPLATGMMTVSNQAVVTFTSAANGVVTLGDEGFSAGTLTVTGAGSLVQSTGGTAEWWVGGSNNDTGGTGTLNVLNQGHVTTTGRMVLGYGSGAGGNVAVDGAGSQLDVNGDYLLVGLNGDGFVGVTGGGKLNVNRMFVANAAGSAGSELDLTGTGSVVNVDRLLHVGDSNRGTVLVSAGGRLNIAVGVPAERLIIGDQDAADGSKLTVSGANSRVDYHGTADVAVGNAGGANTANIADRATLEVTSGGVFSAVQRNPDTSIASQARVIIGDTIGGNGRVLVDGPGSLVEASSIYVGDGDSASSGILDVSNGGSATTTAELEVGSFGSGVGTANIDGPTSTLSVGTYLSLGDDTFGGATNGASGTLNITKGGTIANGGQAFIGHFTGSFGTATVGSASADTSSWTIGGELTIAGTEVSSQTSGSGVLNVNAGGRVVVASNLRIRNLGDVNLGGGEIRVGDGLVFTDAGSTFNFTSGMLRFTKAAGYTLSGAQLDGILGIGHTLGVDQHLAVDGTTVLSAPLRLNGGTFSVGSISAANLANLDFDAGTFNLTTASLTVGAGGIFGSTLVIETPQSIHVTHQATINAGAKLVVAGGFSASQLTNNGDLVAIDSTVGGPVVNNNNVTVVGSVDFDGLMSGPGDFFGPGTAHFNGGMAPGASPSEVQFEGNVVLAASNTLFIEIGGTVRGDEYDSLSIAGSADLDGLLSVSLAGFTPAIGQQFTILTAGSITNHGLALAGPAANSFSLIVGTSSVMLQAITAGLPGDYNQNGTVDAADYTVWRDHLGSGASLPNDDSAGVGQDDYARWKTHFGEAAGSAAVANAAVPEPSAIGLLAAAMIAIALRRWN